MFDDPVVYVDIETTGGSYRTSRILEIAVIRVENGKITQEFNSILNPETRIPAQITALTGITATDTADKPTFSDIADELESILRGAIFVAHNVRFDYSFIKQEFGYIGRRFIPRLLCTVRLSRALYPLHKGHSLEALINRHSIPVQARHRAYDDAQAILYFTDLAYRERGRELFDEAVRKQLASQSLPPHLNVKDIDAIDNIPGVYIFRDESRLPLYVGKSITLKKRILSHFQSTSSKELKISQQVHHIETIATNSEFSALILESKLIKELQPIYNRLLRRVSKYAMLVASNEGGYRSLAVRSGSITDQTDLSSIYGMYRNRVQAKKKIEELARVFGLCSKLMGIEKTNGACFRYSLGSCKGACIGKETSDNYNRRFELALEHTKLAVWEYPAAVQVPLADTGESVVIENWVVKGFLSTEGELVTSDDEPSFDVDEYKIIRRFLKMNNSFVRPYYYG